jgi:diguanylate cyclase (GGDEF)-like protein
MAIDSIQSADGVAEPSSNERPGRAGAFSRFGTLKPIGPRIVRAGWEGLRRILPPEVRNEREVYLFVARITGVSIVCAVSLDVFLHCFVMFSSWQVAIYSWIGTVLITLLVATPVTLVVGRAYLGLHRARQEVERQSRTDELTGLGNRRAFREAVACLGDGPFSVAIFDIDYFKAVNDTYGHSAGDAVISKVAAVLTSVGAGQGTLYRMGGEEYVWLHPGSDADTHFEAADAARRAIAAAVTTAGDHAIRVTASCGVAGGIPGGSADTAYSLADRALYVAKASGRNRVWMEGVLGPRSSPPMPSSDDVTWIEAPGRGPKVAA